LFIRIRSITFYRIGKKKSGGNPTLRPPEKPRRNGDPGNNRRASRPRGLAKRRPILIAARGARAAHPGENPRA
jgi:hypothetical protein